MTIDTQSAYNQALFAGMTDGASCMIPPTLLDGSTVDVVCPIVNQDGSEGTWSFTVRSDSTIVATPTYVETKPAPLTRATCKETPPEGQFQKDSTAWIGQCLHLWAWVFQFDSSTGPCSFLGYYGSSPHEYNFQFSNAVIRVDGGSVCDLLDPVVEDSLVELWALNMGTESYNTKIGGGNTYTVFQLVDVDIYG
jgi:hypothetical protein